MKYIFDQFDQDQSGKINVNEFVNACHQIELRPKSDVMTIEEIVEYMDGDRSGQLEFDEFCKIIRSGLFEVNI